MIEDVALVGWLGECLKYIFLFFVAARFSLFVGGVAFWVFLLGVFYALACFFLERKLDFHGLKKYFLQKKHSGLNITNSLQKSANFVLVSISPLIALFLDPFQQVGCTNQLIMSFLNAKLEVNA